MSVGGTWGKILHVDLSDGRRWIEELPDEVYLRLLGGRALGAYLLLKHMPEKVEPLGPDNLLIFVPGILQGTNLPGSGRHGVSAKSPLTGAIASSEAGGWWGHEFKRAGYDALVVHGRAANPIYLWLKDGELSVRPAGHLWGKDTADVEAGIREELGDSRVRVAQIGVAGEQQVRYANIIHDATRAAGRNGLGAVMGSKNLKAVAVRGTLSPAPVHRQRITGVARWFGENYKTLMSWAIEIGTVHGVRNGSKIGNLPTGNFQDAAFPAAESISGQLMQKTILQGRDTCQACPVYCKQIVAHDDREYPDEPDMQSTHYHDVRVEREYGGPEYETLGALGSACRIADLIALAKGNELCNRWGLDTISTGMTIAFTMECVERGLLTAEQTGGFLPHWGSADDMLQAIDLIAHRRGFGQQMAEGSKRLAGWIGNGADAFTVEVKGQELPMHEPRVKFGLGVGYAVAPVGADHMMNFHDVSYAMPGDGLERVNEVYSTGPLATDDLGPEKMRLFYHEVNWRHVQDCALTCQFYPYRYHHLAEALSGVTGHEYTALDVLAVGERAQTLSRIFNLREGLTAADDRLPQRVMKAFDEGPLAGREITPEALYGARNMWYELMGWTNEGVPTQARLVELGLADLLER